MTFRDDEPIECDQCGEMTFAGSSYIKYEGKAFCSEECLKEYLIEHVTYEEKYLMTADDHEMDYGDMKYHEWKDEG